MVVITALSKLRQMDSLAESRRPELSRDLTGTELQRWYWLKDELVVFARHIGVRATGSKDTILQRLAAFLDSTEFHEGERRRVAASQQLSGALTGATVIPLGQRCSQVVRGWFVEQMGESFRFDAAMRDFFATGDGTRTLQDAMDHYVKTRGQGPTEIGSQFEYNRFTRAWNQANPEGSRQDLLAAWHDYRRRPIDERGRI